MNQEPISRGAGKANDFGDNNPDDWDRNPRPDQLALPTEFPPVTRRQPIKRVETKEDLL